MATTTNQMVRFAVAMVLVGGTLVGCSGSGPGYTMRGADGGDARSGDAGVRRDGSSDEGPSQCTIAADDTFCPRYARAFCTTHFACCDDVAAHYADEATCIDEQACACAGNREGAAFATGQVTLDEVAADAMIARIEESASACPGLPFADTDAAAVFRGTLAAGADCSPTGTDYSSLLACAPGSYCRFDIGGATTSHCTPYAAIGATCDDGIECVPGAYCAGGTTEATIDDPATCAASLAPGAPCTDDYQCLSDLCDEASLTCAPFEAAQTWCTDGDGTAEGEGEEGEEEGGLGGE